MLKINLLPDKKRDASGGSVSAGGDNTTVFFALLGGTLLVLIVGLFLFHASKSNEIVAARVRNNTKAQEVRNIQSRTQDHAKVLSDIAAYDAREEAIGHLEGARTGPTSMLVEMSHLLSPGGRPSTDPDVLERMQRDNPTEMFNSTWDPHRLWLRSFSEENRQVVIEGDGRTPEDVGEFMRRMMLSRYFADIRLERSEGGEDLATKVGVQRFKILARVRY